MSKNRLFFTVSTNGTCAKKPSCVPEHAATTRYVYAFRGSHAAECTSVYMSVSACPDKNATTEIMGLFMGNGADASH